jgi:hypothetical protein
MRATGFRHQEVEISPHAGSKTGFLQTALDHAVTASPSAENLKTRSLKPDLREATRKPQPAAR